MVVGTDTSVRRAIYVFIRLNSCRSSSDTLAEEAGVPQTQPEHCQYFMTTLLDGLAVLVDSDVIALCSFAPG